MRDYTVEVLETFRPTVDAIKAIEFCLQQLYRSKTEGIMDEVVARLTFEELIGALLVARDAARTVAQLSEAADAGSEESP